MLNIIYGDVKNSIYNTNVYFKNSYEPEWLDAELAKKMIKDIDDSEDDFEDESSDEAENKEDVPAQDSDEEASAENDSDGEAEQEDELEIKEVKED